MAVEKVCAIIDELTENIEDLNTKYTMGELTMVEYQDEIERITDMDKINSKLTHDKDKQLAETLVSALTVSITC